VSSHSLKISVITPVYNGETMIKDCMASVLHQTYQNKEHVIVDGLSSDNTAEVVTSTKTEFVKLISEKDKGIYDAFNKGISLASGDIICFLSADDMYAHEHVFQSIADIFHKQPGLSMVYGDIIYVDRDDLSKVVRYWKSSPFKPGLFKKGWMAPNTGLFIRKDLFTKYGLFNLNLKMASDYELQFRFFEKYKLQSVYVHNLIVRMRSGGVSNSSLRNIYKSLAECYTALRQQKIRFPFIYIINTLIYRFRQTNIPDEIKQLNHKQVEVLLKNR